jgi:hypothetical protein
MTRFATEYRHAPRQSQISAVLGASRHARQSVAAPECWCRIDMRQLTDVYWRDSQQHVTA